MNFRALKSVFLSSSVNSPANNSGSPLIFACYLGACLAFLACGPSPLFHHLEAAEVAKGVLAASATTAGPAAESAPTSQAPQAGAPQTTCGLFFPKNKLCASLVLDHPASEEEGAQYTLKFWNSETSSAEGPYSSPDSSITVAVVLWMPSMGHGSSPTRVLQKRDPQGNPVAGLYSVQNVWFSMPGDWQVRIQLKQQRQVIEESIVNVQIP
jgi:hypothetical protein